MLDEFRRSGQHTGVGSVGAAVWGAEAEQQAGWGKAQLSQAGLGEGRTVRPDQPGDPAGLSQEGALTQGWPRGQ